jgi:hypothetical protein
MTALAVPEAAGRRPALLARHVISTAKATGE